MQLLSTFYKLYKLNFEQRMQMLKGEVHTVVGRDFDEEGVVFSSGEQQKIAIARAMYRNSMHGKHYELFNAQAQYYK